MSNTVDGLHIMQARKLPIEIDLSLIPLSILPPIRNDVTMGT
jgi:hypothetical protein